MALENNVDPRNITYMFTYEKEHDAAAFEKFLHRRWYDSYVYTGFYLVMVFGGQYIMKDREKFELRPLLAAWSGLLAIFSIIGAFRTYPELFWALSTHGFEYSCCSDSYLDQGTVTSFWTCLFVLSKVVELGDTAFMVLRKQQVIFLHWYHHITVLMYVWWSYNQKIASARYYVVMNFTVHSVMYSYYALRAMKFRIPRWISMMITTMQLIQMSIGIFVILVSYNALSAGRKCTTNYTNITCGLTMYFSYFLLFMNFFYKNYIVKKPLVPQKRD